MNATAATILRALLWMLASGAIYLGGYWRGKARAYIEVVREMKEGKLPRFSISPGGKSITCHVCGKTSWHPEDVRNKYCGFCHVFHDQRGTQAQFFAE